VRRASRLTTERLRELLHYDPSTGLFTWRVARSWMVKAGDVAGRKVTKEGHVAICIDYQTYTAGRLAWQWTTGTAPRHHVEHMNGVPSDSRWDNLRDIRRPGTAIRQGVHSQGFTDRGAGRRRFRARVYCDGRSRWVGGFLTRAEAREAYWFAKAFIAAASQESHFAPLECKKNR
jgi:hypothetical protein